ncbi:MAG: hypothetical protein M3Z26_08025 [Bacteroidota bacterium]|nr:hypothetical protein [Bacteroidota bacterium]
MQQKKPFPPHESIRVVPLHQPKAEHIIPGTLTQKKKKKKAATQLTYRGGALLPNVEVFTIFWGADWQTSLKDTATQLNQFYQAILQSTLMDELSEYDTPKYKIGRGKLTGTITITENAPAQTITDTEIQTQLLSWIKSNKSFPKPNANTLYFIYFDTGISVSMGGSSSCSSFCGYHNNADTTTFYAVMPYPDCAGCLGGNKPLDALTATSSHELCEAITDPIPGSGWYDDTYGEIGDICAWKFKTLDGYNVQLEWSNKNNKCI